MSIISRSELSGIDIDWYCLINNHSVHIASMCGFIPKKFCERKSLKAIEYLVVGLPTNRKVILNDKYIRQIVNGRYNYIYENQLEKFVEQTFGELESFNYDKNWPEVRLYAMTFVNKAQKGFYSYARDGSTNRYVLVTSPDRELERESIEQLGLVPLPVEINIAGIPDSIDINPNCSLTKKVTGEF